MKSTANIKLKNFHYACMEYISMGEKTHTHSVNTNNMTVATQEA